MGESPEQLGPVYLEAADILYYSIRDTTVVARKLDRNFDVLLDVTTREPIGFQVWGARKFFDGVIPQIGETNVHE